MRKLTQEVTVGALLHGIAPLSLSPQGEKAVAFAHGLLSGSGAKENKQPLLSVFTHLNGEHPGMVIYPRIQDENLVLPGQRNGAGETSAGVLEKLKKEVTGRSLEEKGLTGVTAGAGGLSEYIALPCGTGHLPV